MDGDRITGRPRPWAAWAVILALVAWVVLGQRVPRDDAADADAADAPVGDARPEGAAARPDVAEEGSRLRRAVVELQAKYFVGAAALAQRGGGAFDAPIDELDGGDVGQRLGHVILVGELHGAAAAIQALDELTALADASHHELTRDESLAATLLWSLYSDLVEGSLDVPSLDEDDREFLHAQLGWLGRLALAPADGPDREARDDLVDGARNTALGLAAAFVAFLALVVIALFGIVTLAWRYAGGRLRCGIGGTRGCGGYYVEAFALWLALFVVLSLATAFLPPQVPELGAMGAVFALSLVAVGWPVARGVPWSRVRRDIGWTLGKRPVAEPFVGVVAYVLCLPLLLVGIVLFVVGQYVDGVFFPGAPVGPFAPLEMPSHPVVEPFLGADWNGRLQVVILGCIAAPIVEETMFRGFLYRHLRELSARFGLVASALVSALVSGFFFAVIHPQGILAVPLLMALASGFAFTREWRGTLIPSMVAHALNNGVALSAGVLLFGG